MTPAGSQVAPLVLHNPSTQGLCYVVHLSTLTNSHDYDDICNLTPRSRSLSPKTSTWPHISRYYAVLPYFACWIIPAHFLNMFVGYGIITRYKLNVDTLPNHNELRLYIDHIPRICHMTNAPGAYFKLSYLTY